MSNEITHYQEQSKGYKGCCVVTSFGLHSGQLGLFNISLISISIMIAPLPEKQTVAELTPMLLVVTCDTVLHPRRFQPNQ